MRWILAALLLVGMVSAYHGGLTYNDYGAHYGYSNYDYYGSSLYGYGYSAYDNYYTYYYPHYQYHQRERYNDYYSIYGSYPKPRYTSPYWN